MTSGLAAEAEKILLLKAIPWYSKDRLWVKWIVLLYCGNSDAIAPFSLLGNQALLEKKIFLYQPPE